MNKGKLTVYWIATALLSFGMLGSGISQVLRLQAMVDLVTPLGYPVYFLSILGTWKILGVIAILVPGVKLLKEWAYAGFFFAMTGAFASHLFVSDGFRELLGPFFQTIFVICSWYFRPDSRKIGQTTDTLAV